MPKPRRPIVAGATVLDGPKVRWDKTDSVSTGWLVWERGRPPVVIPLVL